MGKIKKPSNPSKEFSNVSSNVAKLPQSRKKTSVSVSPVSVKSRKSKGVWHVEETSIQNSNISKVTKRTTRKEPNPTANKKKIISFLNEPDNFHMQRDAKLKKNGSHKKSKQNNASDTITQKYNIKVKDVNQNSNISKVTKPTTRKALNPTADKKKIISSSSAPDNFHIQSDSKLKKNDSHKKSKQNNSTETILKNYNIKVKDVNSAINGIVEFRASNPKLKNQLFNESFPLFLQVNCHQVPLGHPKLMRIPMKNCILNPEDEICLIVSEVKGIGNKEHEKHIEHYENLLKTKGVTNVKRIMTMHELRTEYETFEQKSRLVDLYDMFLVCGKISGKVVKNCGKIFYKKRKIPIPVKLQSSNLKDHVNKMLSKVFFHLHLKGDSYTFQFGHNKMSTEQLVENLCSAFEFLENQFPGGFENIKGLHVFAPRTPSIPIYISTEPPTDKKVRVKTPKTKTFKTQTGELSTLPNANVTVRPTGEVIVKKISSDREASENITSENITDEDIIKANKEEADNRETSKQSKKRKVKEDDVLTEDGAKQKKIDKENKPTKKSLKNKDITKKADTDKRKNVILNKKNKLKKIKKLQQKC
ncbi:uncharacterized protein [Leptinotarsa decemlineata]|uniref:uncharacterized protein n=1 Tax=Leptinotarsa decemlineata TaxID=7539 RepID=UPI003D304A47